MKSGASLGRDAQRMESCADRESNGTLDRQKTRARDSALDSQLFDAVRTMTSNDIVNVVEKACQCLDAFYDMQSKTLV